MMKKVNFILAFAFMLSAAIGSFAQTSTKPDFFVGTWEIKVIGTPNGDSKMVASLMRDGGGNLTGQLVNSADSTAEKFPIAITEEGNRILMGFTAQGYDVTIDLTKVDDDNLKGNLMNMFDAVARRRK